MRVVLALAAVHALSALEIRTLRLDDIDLPTQRITARGTTRPLDPHTLDALTCYIDERRSRWPRTANPHLLLSPVTAHADGPVSHRFMARHLHELGLTITQLKTDRILDEAIATDGDPLHLSQVFGLSHASSCHYANAIRDQQETETPTLETSQ
jgi:integrase